MEKLAEHYHRLIAFGDAKIAVLKLFADPLAKIEDAYIAISKLIEEEEIKVKLLKESWKD